MLVGKRKEFPFENWRAKFEIVLSIAMDPSLVAGSDEREPRKAPIGVRATPTMQTSNKDEKNKAYQDYTIKKKV